MGNSEKFPIKQKNHLGVMKPAQAVDILSICTPCGCSHISASRTNLSIGYNMCSQISTVFSITSGNPVFCAFSNYIFPYLSRVRFCSCRIGKYSYRNLVVWQSKIEKQFLQYKLPDFFFTSESCSPDKVCPSQFPGWDRLSRRCRKLPAVWRRK